MSEDPRLRPEYNDPDLVIDKDIKKELIDNGMDERLATHFAHLFIRDPLVIFRETLEASPEGRADHFEVYITFVLKRGVTIKLTCVTEHTIDKLAAHAVQTSSTGGQYWLEG